MSGKTIRYVFFDLGGVLISLRDSFAMLSDALGKPQPDVIAAYARHAEAASRGRIRIEEFWARIEQDLGISGRSPIKDYMEFWVSSYKVHPETRDFFGEIARGYRIGIITNTEFGVVEKMLEKRQIPALPYVILIKSCDVGYAKPDQEIYRIAQERSGARPAEILFVDDRDENVAAAKAAGWHAVQFDDRDLNGAINAVRAYLRA